ncbi:NUDIX domain containing protein, putative [Leishmania lindenbergi]|uniref:NUDIX domain containing protein n=1 Tax=Leishmania lindenbergi TaxID=651832 RepID=A0AAW3A2P4_9TRYP
MRKLVNEQTHLAMAERKIVIIRGKDGCAYRRSIQVFFMNESAEFLLCQPLGECNDKFLQTVQGGSEGEESPQETARRETWEEIGLNLEKDATFICEVQPPPAAVLGEEGQARETRNEANEIVSEHRSAFRYKSKTWAKQGIRGQELYPLLYFLGREKVQHINTHGWERGIRAEFRSVKWGLLAELVEKAPPSKKAVMKSVCSAVAAAAKSFVESCSSSTAGLPNVINEEPLVA